jgi:hypothetical protein
LLKTPLWAFIYNKNGVKRESAAKNIRLKAYPLVVSPIGRNSTAEVPNRAFPMGRLKAETQVIKM